MEKEQRLVYKIRRKAQTICSRALGMRIMTKVYYRIIMRRSLNLRTPQYFSEKICKYKLDYCPTNELIVTCSDKIRVYDYLATKGLEGLIVPRIGYWDRAEDIPWQTLPEKFVLKCNHGCRYNVICNNKGTLDIDYSISQLSRWMKEDFGYFNCEPHYNKITKAILGEEFLDTLSETPTDYKIHCFNGVPKVLLICSARKDGDAKLDFFDINLNRLNFGKQENDVNSLLPKYLQQMIDICNIIAADFSFVRIDFYESENRIYLGELSFTPAAGYVDYLTTCGDFEMGQYWSL